MTALEELGRSLARAVDAGAAADPAVAPGRAGAARTARRRRRLGGWRLLGALLLAGGATTGALAATGHLPVIGPTDRGADPNYLMMRMPGSAPEATAAPTLLPLRVRDPLGGPVWALRTFPIARGRRCAQVGQLYGGQFGIVTDVRDPARDTGTTSGPAWGMRAFQVLPASAALPGVRCGTERAGGRLITSGRNVAVLGAAGGDLRCGNSPPPAGGRCPITGVRVVRWGFLGPEAESASFVDADGRARRTQRVRAATGGAYLFAESVDPAPFRAARAFDAELRRKIDERYPRIPYGSIPRSERAAADRRWRQRNAFVLRVYRAARSQRRAIQDAQQGDHVEATFAGGDSWIVAGRGASGRRLPGVAPVPTPPPRGRGD